MTIRGASGKIKVPNSAAARSEAHASCDSVSHRGAAGVFDFLYWGSVFELRTVVTELAMEASSSGTIGSFFQELLSLSF